MKSTKTQRTLSSRSNKENDAVNGKCSALTRPTTSASSFDWTKREALNDQRKLRLTQVRKQSKEIATQIRDNVRKEEQRQLDVVNDIRQSEFLDWRQKQMQRIDSDYQHCLTHVGEAHVAAQRENEKQRAMDEQKEKNRRMALKRGKLAAEKLKEAKTGAKPACRPVCKKAVTIVERNSAKTPTTPANNARQSTSSTSSSLSSSSISSEDSVCSVIRADRLKSSRSTGSLKHLSETPKKSELKSSRSTGSSPAKKPTKYVSINGSAVIDLSLSDHSNLSDASPVPITKITQLIKGSDIPYEPSPKTPAQPFVSRTYKVSSGDDVPMQRAVSKAGGHTQTITTTPTSSLGTKPVAKAKGASSQGRAKGTIKQYVPEFVRTKAGSLVAGKKATPTSTLPQKVQFYDHANRFSKEYDTHIDLVDETHEANSAWDAAARENHRQFSNHFGSRKLEAERAKVGLHKEKIRKDYDLMSSQLSSILKDDQLTKSFLDTNEMLCESRLRQLAEEKQLLMQNDFRGLLTPSVPITCPKVAAQPAHRERRELNVAPPAQNASLNDSHSFLLDYLVARTNNICDDIDRCRIEKNQLQKQTKIRALHTLLNKVNTLRRILCEEIDGNTTAIDANRIIDEVDALAREQHKIMDEKSTRTSREHELEEREKMLQAKESCIDKRVYELYLREKKIKAQNGKLAAEDTNGVVKRSTIVAGTGAKALGDEMPVKIIINLNSKEDGPCGTGQDPVKWSDRLKKSAASEEPAAMAPAKVTQPNVKAPSAKSKTITFERRHLDEASQSTSVTAYYSPPEQLATKLTKALQSSPVAGTNTRANAPNVHDNELLQYIVRLMGMSRTSIEQLNVSSVSTVRTPNSSVINISNNRQYISSTTATPLSMSSLSFDRPQSMDTNKMQQLARFLANQHPNGLAAHENGDSDMENGTWNNILGRKSERSKSKSEPSDRVRSIAGRAEGVAAGRHNLAGQEGQNDLISKYDELTANCTKRIIDLDSMISRVREEKQKILENTLSSGGSLIAASRENQTEYLEYAGPQPHKTADTDDGVTLPLSDSKSTNAPSSDFDTTPNEQRPNLMATRLNACGGSKDSGVGNSRPVTSSDFRESPDLRQSAKVNDAEAKCRMLAEALRDNEMKTAFEPMLKDIPKSSYRIGNDNGAPLVAGGAAESGGPANGREKNGKHPPIALARYSPHMEDDGPHELSTITEVDTPATSRLNATDLTCAGNDPKNTSAARKMSENDILAFLYNHFPNFKEYIRSHGNASLLSMASADDNLEMTQRASQILGEKLESILGCGDAEQLKYRAYNDEGPKMPDDTAIDSGEQNLCYAKFPTHSQYMASDHMLDTQSVDPLQLSDLGESTDSTLPDIESELRKRNIITAPFRQPSEVDERANATAINRMVANVATDSLSESLENDLQKMGLNWVSSMIKKTKTATQLDSTSSESMGPVDKSGQRSHRQRSPAKLKGLAGGTREASDKANDSNSFIDKNILAASVRLADTSLATEPTDAGQSMNLKEFLARELLKHSSTSSMSTDSSLGSLLLRSFLGRSLDETSATPRSREKDKHRTSTPVQQTSGLAKGGSSTDSRSEGGEGGERKDEAGAMNLTPRFFSIGSNISSVGSNDSPA